MARTKWMRLTVRDLGDVLRWAEAQNARQIDTFRCRHIGGAEAVSFRLVPRYPIEIGTRDVIVVAIVRGSNVRALTRRLRALYRRAAALLAVPPGTGEPIEAPTRPIPARRVPHPR